MAVERLIQVGDPLSGLVGDEALARAAGQQRGARRGLQARAEAQGARVLRGGLAMGAGGRCALGGGGREAQDGAGVAGSLGVIGKPRKIGVAERVGRERLERAAMQRHPQVGRERLLDGHAREVVPEGDTGARRPEHAARQALLEVAGGVAGERLEQRQLDGPAHDRGGVEQPPRRRAQRRDAGEHGIAHRRGQLEAAGGERLGDEERVAGRAPVQLGGVDAVRLGQLGDGLLRQRLEPQPIGVAA